MRIYVSLCMDVHVYVCARDLQSGVDCVSTSGRPHVAVFILRSAVLR